MNRTSFAQLQWLFPIAVTLHNGEEAIWMPVWAARHAGRLPVHPGAMEIRMALLVLTVAAWIVTYLSAGKGTGTVWAYLLFGAIVAMLANVFVPHLPATVLFHGYTPGVATAAFINLPVMSWLAWLAVQEGWVRGWKAAAFGVGVPAVLAAIVVLFAAGI